MGFPPFDCRKETVRPGDDPPGTEEVTRGVTIVDYSGVPSPVMLTGSTGSCFSLSCKAVRPKISPWFFLKGFVCKQDSPYESEREQ